MHRYDKRRKNCDKLKENQKQELTCDIVEILSKAYTNFQKMNQ